MCTVTVRRDERGQLVTMNRDEARNRAPESPPMLAETSTGPAWIAPRDGASGGTWMGVNALGLVACLLNRYVDATPAAPGAASRGEIVPGLLAQGTLKAARTWLEHAVDPARYAPFTLVLVDAEASVVAGWDGRAIEWSALAAPWAMVTSSLFDSEQVLAWRTEAFAAWRAAGAPFEGALPAFHLLQPAGEAFCAPLMSRPVSCTRSITQAEVPPAGACLLRYAPVDGAPGPLSTYVLPPPQETHPA